MFRNCSKLTSIDISSFDMRRVQNYDAMFSGCNSLKILTLGEYFNSIGEEVQLPNGDGWVNTKAPSKVVSGSGEFAVITNDGKNIYKRLGTDTENRPTYPTNIKVEYSRI